MNERTKAGPESLADLAAAFGDVARRGLQLGIDFFGSLMSGVKGAAAGQACGCGAGCGGGCEIPPPCWMPKPLGELTSYVCSGGTATVRIQIENGGLAARTFRIDVAGKAAGGAQAVPATLALGPMERGTVVVSAASADSELIVWVRGCSEHFLRWTIRTDARGGNCCHEICVCDFPRLIHHWSDHFYCQSPCAQEDTRLAS
jgi:hypothetical protein